MSLKVTMTIKKGAKDRVIQKFEKIGKVEVLKFEEGKWVDHLVLEVS